MRYKEIKYLGNLDGCIDELLKYKAKGQLVSIDFNGHILYSDTITVDGAYQEVLGDTKAEWEERCERERQKYEKHKREHEASIPNKTKYWRDKARGIIREDGLDYWDEIVPIRLKDLYEGMELECCIELAKLTKDNLFEEAKEKLSNQGHSGMSYRLVCSMVKIFAENGVEFLKYIEE